MWMGLSILALFIIPAAGTGLSGSSSCQAKSDAEAYCINNGGCPKDGNCYFADGSFCDLLSFYNGTCPGKEYYEQVMWMAEAYNFLNSDTGYYSPYSANGGQYPYSYPNGYYNSSSYR